MNYPSPGGEGMDAGPFYHTHPRDDVPEQQAEPEAPPPEPSTEEVHQHIDASAQPQEPEPSQVKDSPDDVPPPDPATPQQHAARPANLEELQLAAQLGQGLAGAPIMAGPDPNISSDEQHIRNMIEQHQEEDHHHQHQQQHQQQHPPQHQPTPSYLQDTPTSGPMAHVLPLGMSPSMGPQYAMGDNVPPRKRSKVSRACDECRRKKIKCDSQSDTGETPCSSCARSNIRCLFSRVPQKRGPSKGYDTNLIKRCWLLLTLSKLHQGTRRSYQ